MCEVQTQSKRTVSPHLPYSPDIVPRDLLVTQLETARKEKILGYHRERSCVGSERRRHSKLQHSLECGSPTRGLLATRQVVLCMYCAHTITIIEQFTRSALVFDVRPANQPIITGVWPFYIGSSEAFILGRPFVIEK